MLLERSETIEHPFDVEAYLSEIKESLDKPVSFEQSIKDAVEARLRDEFMPRLWTLVDQYKPPVPVDVRNKIRRGDGVWVDAFTCNEDYTLGTGTHANAFYSPYIPLSGQPTGNDSTKSICVKLANTYAQSVKDQKGYSHQQITSPQILEFIDTQVCERVISQLNPLISIIPMQAPVAVAYHLDAKNEMLQLCSTAVSAQVRKVFSFSLESFYDRNTRELLTENIGLIINDIARSIIFENVSSLSKACETIEIESSTFVMDSLRSAVLRGMNEISSRSRRGKGNWVLCDPSSANALCGTGPLDHKANIDKDAAIAYVGTLYGTIDVYSTLALPAGEILCGYRSKTPHEIGFLYSPYQMTASSGILVNPSTFQSCVSFMTRGASTMLNESYYYKMKLTYNAPVFS
jgi:hypothetical protein